MSVIAIIGAGELGGATAQAIAALECVTEVRLIDSAASVAEGKALDIRQAAASEGYATRVTAAGDPRAAAGAIAIVFADASGSPSRELQGEEGLALLRRTWDLVERDRGVIVCAGAAHASLMGIAVRELGIDRRRIIGTAAAAFESGARAIVAATADAGGHEICVMTLGAPPALFACWSQASAGGHALTSRLSAAQLAALDARLPRLWPPGPYALASAAARACAAIARGSRSDLTTLVMLDGEMRNRGRVAALPVRLGPSGVVEIREPDLSAQERVRFENALV